MQFEVPLPTVVKAIELAKRHGVRVIVDPAPALAEVPREIFQVAAICPNESEAEALTGIKITSVSDAVAAAKKMRLAGPELSLVTLGDRGVVVCDSREIRHLPAFSVEAVDTTAAGDAFAAALGIAVCEGLDAFSAARFASAAGALAATRHGAQPAMPTRAEVEQLLATQPGDV